jgi:hypothetical protein
LQRFLLITSSKIKKKSQNSRKQDFFTFLLVDGRIRIRTNNDGSGYGRPKNVRILRIRIHNTDLTVLWALALWDQEFLAWLHFGTGTTFRIRDRTDLIKPYICTVPVLHIFAFYYYRTKYNITKKALLQYTFFITN